MISLSKLLRLQALYSILGILFNVVSWIALSKNGESLTPTAPVSGIVVMAIYGLFLLAGHFKKISLYRMLMLVALLILGYGGIFSHLRLLSQSPDLYPSLWIGILAILINTFGWILNSLGALGRFRLTGMN
ncbi:MAG: hypothetical protein HRU41_00165 [Saprospiraceae bacterium]|nr:hypothetical protein [Saprospiraceae bacterium]